MVRSLWYIYGPLSDIAEEVTMAGLIQNLQRLISHAPRVVLPSQAFLAASRPRISALQFSSSAARLCDAQEEEVEAKNPVMPTVSVQTSIRYVQSQAYADSYKGEPVWVPYRRNHKGSIQPSRTRTSCIHNDLMTTGNPCPICRDEFLVVHEDHIELLEQFIDEKGDVLSILKTGLCSRQYKKLLVAVTKARDAGMLEMPIPVRRYDYSVYYPHLRKQTKKVAVETNQ